MNRAVNLKEYAKDVTTVEQDKWMWAKAMAAIVCYMILAGLFYTNVECCDERSLPDVSCSFDDDGTYANGGCPDNLYWSWVDAVYYAVATLTTVLPTWKKVILSMQESSLPACVWCIS